MAFYLQVSNSLEQLAKKLGSCILTMQQDVFQPVYLVTQTEGMNNWLKMQLAEQIGIAANCSFLKPNDLVNRIYFLVGGSFTQNLSADNLNWLLYKLLGEEHFIARYPSIAAYYGNEAEDKEVKRMALAKKVSDLFDQYQVYRPEMIQRWNNDLPGFSGDDAWQKELWLSAKKVVSDKFPDKTLIGKKIKEALKSDEHTQRLQRKMPAVYLFGISMITEYHLEIFQELAEHIDIYFLLLNPAPSVYWLEDKSEKQLSFLKKIGKLDHNETGFGNPLLTAWGKVIQDTFSLLFKNDELINNYEEVGVIEPAQDSLLHKIQSAIFQNEVTPMDSRFTNTELMDGSVTVNSCFSPAREVEVLYNYLVHLVDRKGESLSPRDIVVMVSDINLYASYIKAIFSNAPYPFRYTIADESYAASDSISTALHALLTITEDNFTAEEVTRLLDSAFIRKRFQLMDIPLIRTVLDEANIRFGINGSKEDDTIYISWTYGLKRIMFGICLGDDEEYGIGEDSFYPVNMVEGNAAHEVIRFVHFAEQLMNSIKERKRLKSIAGWVEYVDGILHGFVCSGEEADDDYVMMVNQLEEYNAITEIFTELVSYEVFMHHFLETITRATRQNSFAMGGITFCSLIPMRSIPFKVVALLGLNFDKFPRKENSPGFNLMENEKRKGDRNVKENDKHLFLETILSARDYLYISYIGQSIKDNSNIPPSTLIDELVDYISACATEPGIVRATLIMRHPLHGFSKLYHSGNSRMYTYLGAQKPVISNLRQQQPALQQEIKEVSLDRLSAFLKNPFKGYYNSVLGIYYNENEIALSDTEIFELGSLQKWALKNQLLTINENKELDNFKTRLVKTGGLPLKNMADVQLRKLEEDVEPVRNLFLRVVQDQPEEKREIDITIKQFHLTGTVRNVFDDKLVVVSWSKRETKYLLGAYIHYLALLASGKAVTGYFISGNKEAVYVGTAITREMAVDRLGELLILYAEGYEKILPFDPDLDILPREVETLDQNRFRKALKTRFENFNAPCNDAYLNREYANGFFLSDNIIENYQSAAQKLLVPLGELFPEYYKK